MVTKRQAIDILREKLRERNADSKYSNYFLYNVLSEHAKWLIKREVQKGRIYTNAAIFQTLSCVEVIETSTIEECCPIKTNCKIFRTKEKLPEIWTDNNGPIIKHVTSVDNSSQFYLISIQSWNNKRNDPYEKQFPVKYAFYADGYIWFPELNPRIVNIYAFFTDDVQRLSSCEKIEKCIRFLDTRFMIPDWLEAEMYAKAMESLMISKQVPEEEQIDKNVNRKN